MACAVAGCGGTPTALASGQDYPWRVAVDGSNVYWANYFGPASVMEVPIAGGIPTALATGESNPAGIVVRGGSVFWSDTGSGRIQRLTPE